MLFLSFAQVDFGTNKRNRDFSTQRSLQTEATRLNEVAVSRPNVVALPRMTGQSLVMRAEHSYYG